MGAGKYVRTDKVGKTVEKKFGVEQILSIAAILVCLITLFLPWLYAGIKTDSGRTLDLTDLFDVTDLGSEVRSFETSDLPDAAARKELRSARKAVSQLIDAVRDSKLTPVETASGLINLAKIENFLSEYADENASEEVLWIFIIGAVLWLLLLIFAILSIRCILADLKGKKGPLKGALCIYLVLFLLHIIPTVYVNLSLKDAMSDSLGASLVVGLFGVENSSLLHIQCAPILGIILLAGALIVRKKGISAKSIPTAEVRAITNKMIWKCECGAVNPTSSKFCPQCGKIRPEDISSLNFKKDVIEKVIWTCSCGNRNPSGNAFCSKCGAKRP